VELLDLRDKTQCFFNLIPLYDLSIRAITAGATHIKIYDNEIISPTDNKVIVLHRKVLLITLIQKLTLNDSS